MKAVKRNDETLNEEKISKNQMKWNVKRKAWRESWNWKYQHETYILNQEERRNSNMAAILKYEREK